LHLVGLVAFNESKGQSLSIRVFGVP